MRAPAPARFTNPILPGFYPDPTICRVGDDFYLALSSFAYFPGIPLFHSRDLVNWRPVGHALHRREQFPRGNRRVSEGIFAPTLRHDGKRFWLITTDIGGRGNFVITADRIEGPWSDPVALADAPGIDPSLLFDTDGRVWVTGTAEAPEGARYFGNNEVWLRELDPVTLAWKGDRIGLWRGALREAVWPEGPHLYHRGDWYYLLISEGGTAGDHAVTIARSRSVTGPYEGYRANPILTHRHLGRGQAFVYTGHADLVETPTGQWWMVLLASRPTRGQGIHRGRETFLAPVVWEDDWPVVSAGSGRLEATYPRPDLPWTPWPGLDRSGAYDGFDAPSLGPAWAYLRTPTDALVDLETRPGWLRLRGQGRVGSRDPLAWVGRRLAHDRWVMQAKFDALTGAGGLLVVQNDEFTLRLEVEGDELRVVSVVAGVEAVVARAPRPQGPQFHLEVTGDGLTLSFRASADGARWAEVASAVDGSHLTTDRAGGFVGCLAGPYAVGQVDVDGVDYRGTDEA